jgi:uroporphyrinogen decarboxylase
MATMTGRERIMTALHNQQPDRVPATPDISIMVPCRLTGKPFWEIEVNETPRLTSAYIQAAKHFGIDGWLFCGTLNFRQKGEVWSERKITRRDPERWEVHTVIHTPDGDLAQHMVSPSDNPSTMTEKPIKNLKDDFKKVRHLFADVVGYDDTRYREQQREMGDHGMICVPIDVPGFQNVISLFDGGVAAIAYAYQDYPDLFAELVDLQGRVALQKAEMALDAGVDSILTGGSGSITLQSPALFRKLSLPTLVKMTRMSRQAGVLCGIHSCGKERAVVQMCAEETDLDWINPLEIPPMGDCDLAECKQKWGSKVALMGNLHTTSVMLQGTVQDVRREGLKCVRAAGANGGFVLSTGDQCGRDTPFENILEIVRVCKEFGQYPLDLDRIDAEIARLS